MARVCLGNVIKFKENKCMFNKKIVEEVLENIEKKENENRIPKNLVEVRFEDGFTLSYFSDLPEIKVGDVVTVEGKMENQIAVVKKVLKSFKKPKFEMKWISGVIDTNIAGVYFKIEDDVVSLDTTLTVEKFLSIYAGVKYKENEAVGEDDIELNLEELEKSDLFDDELVKIRGQKLFKDGFVPFIYLKSGVGKAVVRSSNGDEWYEIDFRCKRGRITYIACDCPYFGNCKHLYAFLLKLRDFSKKFFEKYNNDSFVMCKKECFNYIMSYGKGRVTIEL